MARGFTETGGLIDRIPAAARERLGYLLAEMGVEASAAQKAVVAKDTGFLAQGLTVDLMLEQLRVRAGLMAMQKGKRSSRFYGRFVNFGRRAQTVRVIRGTSASKRSHTSRTRRAAGLKLRKPYTLRVKAMAPREFIVLPQVEERLMRRTAQFWSEVLPA